MPPAISVIIPTKDRAQWLERSLPTVLNQTYTECEVIVVDDGSSDRTPEVLKAMAKQHPDTLTTLRHEQPMGAPAARNAGAQIATGDLIAFNDDDTFWHPDKVSLQTARWGQEADAGVVYANVRIRTQDGRDTILGSPAAETRDPFHALLDHNFLSISSGLIRRDLFETAGGFDEELPRLQDWDLWLRLARMTSFAYVDRTLSYSELLEGGISDRSEAIIPACERICTKLADRFHISGTPLARALLHCGYHLMASGQKKEARRYLKRAVRADPTSVRTWGATLLAHLGRPAYLAIVHSLAARVQLSSIRPADDQDWRPASGWTQ